MILRLQWDFNLGPIALTSILGSPIPKPLPDFAPYAINLSAASTYNGNGLNFSHTVGIEYKVRPDNGILEAALIPLGATMVSAGNALAGAVAALAAASKSLGVGF